MRQYIFLFLLPLCFLFSCTSGEGGESTATKKAIATLHDEVMGIHDEIMPNHMKLQNLQQELEGKLKDLNASGSADSATVVDYHQAIDHLGKAVKGMDDWMHKWDPSFNKKEKSEAFAYLKEQKEIMEQVKKDFVESEAVANSLLDK